jgi:hypothetical protein
MLIVVVGGAAAIVILICSKIFESLRVTNLSR